MGKTALLGDPEKVPKNHTRVEAYGTIDELNSMIGLLRTCDLEKNIDQKLYHLQNVLFSLGSELANTNDLPQEASNSFEKETASLEKDIDLWTQDLAPLKYFILPGGSLGSSYSHLARTICRRAERTCVPLMESGELRPLTFSFINRLSDWFFTLARILNHQANMEDVRWEKS